MKFHFIQSLGIFWIKKIPKFHLNNFSPFFFLATLSNIQNFNEILRYFNPWLSLVNACKESEFVEFIHFHFLGFMYRKRTYLLTTLIKLTTPSQANFSSIFKFNLVFSFVKIIECLVVLSNKPSLKSSMFYKIGRSPSFRSHDFSFSDQCYYLCFPFWLKVGLSRCGAIYIKRKIYICALDNKLC